MKITKEDVARISVVARLELDEDSQSRFAEQLTQVLKVINALDEVDTSGMDQMISLPGSIMFLEMTSPCLP